MAWYGIVHVMLVLQHACDLFAVLSHIISVWPISSPEVYRLCIFFLEFGRKQIMLNYVH